SIDHRDLVFAHQIGNAVGQPVSHFAAALDHAGQIEAHIVGGKAELRGSLHRVIKLRGAKPRLGRDASPVEADAAEMLALDDGGVQPELRCADRGDIATGSRADNGEIETCFAHRKDARTGAANMRVKLTPWENGSIRRRYYFCGSCYTVDLGGSGRLWPWPVTTRSTSDCTSTVRIGGMNVTRNFRHSL